MQDFFSSSRRIPGYVTVYATTKMIKKTSKMLKYLWSGTYKKCKTWPIKANISFTGNKASAGQKTGIGMSLIEIHFHKSSHFSRIIVLGGCPVRE
jgi:hypothetical protein